MKPGIIRWALFVSALFLAMSCYKDLSTEATQSLPDIEITSELERLDVFYGETLTFTPEVKIKGRKQSDIEYKWEMTITPLDDDFVLELGTEKSLSYFVANTPSSTPYVIRLTVTDKETGLYRSKCWDTYVASSLGEGILVAHTDNGGETSELSLLKAKPVTEGYTAAPRYTHNLFSMSNGAPIQGRVNALVPVVSSNLSTYNLNRVYIGTDTDLIAVDYLDYKEDERNESLFQFKEGKENVKVEHLFNYAEYATGLISDGCYYNCLCLAAYLYSQVPYHNTPSNIFSKATLAATKSSFGGVFLVDVNQGSFFYQQGRLLGTTFSELPVKPTYSMSGATPLACGIMKQDKVCFLIKTSDGAYYATVISSDGMTSTSSDYNVSEVAQDIDDAKGFTFCDNADFFYYYTDKAINVVITAGKTATHRVLSWEPDEKEEKITGLYQYQQGWYSTQQISDYEHLIDTHRLQMLITTYNESTGEGKIYIRPFNVSTGLFTKQDNGTYGGFNEITALMSTLR